MQPFILRRMAALTLACVILLGLSGCSTEQGIALPTKTPLPPQSTPQVSMPPTASAPNPKLVTASTRFGFKLFSELQKQEKDKNIFISPSSVAIALAMTYNGASGTTQQAMAKALEIQGMSLSEVNQGSAALQALLANPDPKVQLTIANALWAKKGAALKPGFIQRNQTFYHAKVAELDFSDPGSAKVINAWVKEKTGGKIDRMVDKLKPEDVLFLINAIYFKGKWTKPFEKADTQPAPFYLANGRQKQHPFMVQEGEYAYAETEQFQAISLPYGDRRLSFYLFLPKPKANLNTFYQTLNPENWETWMQQFRKRPGSIKLPRFKLETDLELSNALKALGMAEAFDESRANFAELSDAATKIDQVKHKTFVEVNEEGTEAAAATSVGIVATSVQIPQEPFAMVVDRPFFCAIRDNQTGTLLFMGAIVEPQ